ncbi:MAG: SHOCT domain-containing protein [Clostridia bacterium]|nr:SHOCT domain-containing protein [Clostridia bacterium]
MDREMFGATANVKQFYYEDIVSASTEQNSQSSDLTVALLETAITAATKTCTLVITTAGAGLRIDSLYKVEAERIVAVYHHFRKEAKKASSQPQVVVQQQAVDPIEQLEKLSKMKDMGIISEEEFNAKKADLLAKI